MEDRFRTWFSGTAIRRAGSGCSPRLKIYQRIIQLGTRCGTKGCFGSLTFTPLGYPSRSSESHLRRETARHQHPDRALIGCRAKNATRWTVVIFTTSDLRARNTRLANGSELSTAKFAAIINPFTLKRTTHVKRKKSRKTDGVQTKLRT